MATIKRENFSTRSKKLGLNSVPNSNSLIRDYLFGKRIIITANTGGHNYGPIGTIIEVTAMPSIAGGAGNTWGSAHNLIPGGNTIMFTSFSVIEEYTIDMLKEDLNRFKQAKKDIDLEILEVKAKIAFMEENKIDNFDENEFKVYHTLQVINQKDLSEIEKARAIAKLIRG